MELKEPKTQEEFEGYYDLRWRILRYPWNQPRGSEKDSLEDMSIHLILTEEDKILGAGRVHFNSNDEAQVRYMAVEENQQGKGIGGKILSGLEERAKQRGTNYIVLNSRDTAVPFYIKKGYRIIGEAPTMFGTIKHSKMRKDL
ncbi:GNAT family N-acetyltransferase [Candidatus Pacearchaeota archaeon]|nr:GNAT family N-acetyltransferase [Candidatus Pacearchaeota archaeon]